METKMITWKELLEQLNESWLLEEVNPTPTLIDKIKRATAPARHQWRVSETLTAARENADAMNLERPHTAGAALVLARDLLGVGGPGGLGWSNGNKGATERPVLNTLGAGRYHAGDGGAWRSAALEAWRVVNNLGANRPWFNPTGVFWEETPPVTVEELTPRVAQRRGLPMEVSTFLPGPTGETMALCAIAAIAEAGSPPEAPRWLPVHITGLKGETPIWVLNNLAQWTWALHCMEAEGESSGESFM